MIVFEENLITNSAGRFIEVSVSVDDEGIKINGEPCQFDYKLTLTDDNWESKSIDSSRIQNGSVGFDDLDVVKDALACTTYEIQLTNHNQKSTFTWPNDKPVLRPRISITDGGSVNTTL